MRRAFAGAGIFAVNKRIMPSSNGAVETAVEKLADAGVQTVFFDGTDEFEPAKSVVLAFCEEDTGLADKAAFFAAPASAPLEVKMLSLYVSNLDGENAVAEMADLIITAKKS